MTAMVGGLSVLSASFFALMYLLVRTLLGDARSGGVRRGQAPRPLEQEEDAAFLHKVVARDGGDGGDGVVLLPSGAVMTGAEIRQWSQPHE